MGGVVGWTEGKGWVLKEKKGKTVREAGNLSEKSVRLIEKEEILTMIGC